MTKLDNTRNSSIELLRIICMLFIIAHHYTGAIFSNYDVCGLSFNNIVVQMVKIFPNISNVIFIIITGYYYIDSNCSNHYKKIIKLIIETYFYSITIPLVFMVLNIIKFEDVNLKEMFLPIFYGNWYIVTYIQFFLFIPFINRLLKNLNKSEHRILILISITIMSIIRMFISAYEISNLDYFLTMYIVGSYIRIYKHDDFKYKNIINLIIAISLILLIMIFTIMCDYMTIQLNVEKYYEIASRIKRIYSLPIILSSLFIFLFFSNIEFHSKTINKIASTCVGVLLLHYNSIFKSYIFNIKIVDYNCVLISILIETTVIFIVCSLIDFIRQFIFSFANKVLRK